MTDKEKESHIKWLTGKIAKAKKKRKPLTGMIGFRHQWLLLRGKELAFAEMKRRIKNCSGKF